MPPVEKVTVPNSIVRDSKQAVYDFLVANGWEAAHDSPTWAVACAATHLAWVYGASAVVSIKVERTPAHLLVTVDQV